MVLTGSGFHAFYAKLGVGGEGGEGRERESKLKIKATSQQYYYGTMYQKFLILGKMWSQSKCPSVDQWILKCGAQAQWALPTHKGRAFFDLYNMGKLTQYC